MRFGVESTIEEYVAWLGEAKDTRLAPYAEHYARYHRGEIGWVHLSALVDGVTAIAWKRRQAIEVDVRSILSRGETSGAMYREFEKTRARTEKAAKTREKRKTSRSHRHGARDSQKSKVYAAERAALWGEADGGTGEGGRRFESIEEIQTYVHHLLNLGWVERTWGPQRPIRVGAKHHGNAVSWNGSGSISLPRWAWRQEVVLHEVAHTITDRHYGLDQPGHGWAFAKTYLELVRREMGKAAGARLLAEYRARRVKHRQPRTLTPEQREAATARLAEARAARTRS